MFEKEQKSFEYKLFGSKVLTTYGAESEQYEV
jgi:hypothetical protein